jgi:hypothetical protein
VRKLALILALWASFAGAGSAQNVPGNDVYGACQELDDPDRGVRSGFCIGYVNGVWEGIMSGTALMAVRAGIEGADEINRFSEVMLGVCIPPEVERGQLIAVVRKYLEDNPAIRHESARILVYQAFAQAFPCN